MAPGRARLPRAPAQDVQASVGARDKDGFAETTQDDPRHFTSYRQVLCTPYRRAVFKTPLGTQDILVAPLLSHTT